MSVSCVHTPCLVCTPLCQVWTCKGGCARGPMCLCLPVATCPAAYAGTSMSREERESLLRVPGPGSTDLSVRGNQMAFPKWTSCLPLPQGPWQRAAGCFRGRPAARGPLLHLQLVPPCTATAQPPGRPTPQGHHPLFTSHNSHTMLAVGAGGGRASRRPAHTHMCCNSIMVLPQLDLPPCESA